jgi:outer membrane protein TolC
VALRNRAGSLAEELYRANQRRFETGVIPISQVQEAETALANRELNLSLAYQTKELAFESLNRQLNHQLKNEIDVSDVYPFLYGLKESTLPTFEALLGGALDKNVSVQLAKVAIERSTLQQTFLRNQLKPQLDLTLQAGVNGLAGDERTPATASRYAGSWFDSFSAAAKRDGYQWGVGLNFSLPLGNRSAKARLRQADLQLKQASYRQRDVDSQLRSELQQQLINQQRAFEQVKIAEKFERLASLSLQQEQRRLEEGLSDTFRIISFQDNLLSAQIGRINALIQYYSAVARLNYTRGIILEQHNIVLSEQIEEKKREIM